MKSSSAIREEALREAARPPLSTVVLRPPRGPTGEETLVLCGFRNAAATPVLARLDGSAFLVVLARDLPFGSASSTSSVAAAVARDLPAKTSSLNGIFFDSNERALGPGCKEISDYFRLTPKAKLT